MKKYFKFIARIFFIIVCAVGIYTNIVKTNSDAFMGNGTALNFYTLQSNILVLITEVILLFYSFSDVNKTSKFYRPIAILKYITTTAITLTFLVFWGMLAPYMELESLLEPSCILVHVITPIFMIIDFLIENDKEMLKMRDVGYTLIPPVYYLVYCLVRAEISDTTLTGGSRYPYWFIDVDMYGWFGNENGIGVIYWVILMVFIVLGIGFGLMFSKKKLKRNNV